MARISQLSNKETIFIGGDGWGSWTDTEVGKLGNVENYAAYHIVPWGVEACTNDAIKFKQYSKEMFNENTTNKLSYVIYQTVMSVISSYEKYGRILNGAMKNNLLQSYKLALIKDKNWYKPNDYLVYRMHSNQNITYALVNPVTNHSYFYNCENSEKIDANFIRRN